MRIGPVLGGVGIGVLWSIQARAAGELAEVTGDTLLAVFILFAGGAVFILLVAGPSMLRRRRTRPPHGRIPLGLLTGGLFGAVVVWSQTVVIPELGMSLTTAAIVLGSLLTGTLSDVTGFGAAGRVATSAPRVIAIAALAGAVVLAAARFDGVRVETTTVLLVLMAFGVGIGVNIQQTVNGRFGKWIGDPFLPTLLNFALAGAIIGLIWVFAPHPATLAEVASAPLWAFISPPLAAVVVYGMVILSPRLGALAMAATIVAGQLAGGLVLDLVVPVPDRPVGLATVIAVVVALLAAGLVAIPPRNRTVGG